MGKASLPNKLAVITAAALLLVTVALAGVVRQSQAERTTSIVQTFADEFAARLEEKLLTRIAIIDLLRKGWEDGRINSSVDFDSSSASVESLFDDIQAINWVDPNGIITQVTPLKGNEAALGLNLLDLPEPTIALEASTRLIVLHFPDTAPWRSNWCRIAGTLGAVPL